MWQTFLRNEHKLYNWPLYLATDLYTAQVSRCSCHSALSFYSQITFISFVTFQFAKSTFLYFLGYLFVHLCFNVSFWELKIEREPLVLLYCTHENMWSAKMKKKEWKEKKITHTRLFQDICFNIPRKSAVKPAIT